MFFTCNYFNSRAHSNNDCEYNYEKRDSLYKKSRQSELEVNTVLSDEIYNYILILPITYYYPVARKHIINVIHNRSTSI